MTTTSRGTQSWTLLVLGALAGSAVLVATAASVPALATSANPANPANTAHTSSQQRAGGEHRVVHRDARRDVLRFDTETEKSTPAPRDRGTDVTRTVVDHQADQVVLQSRVRHLSRSGYRLMIAEILTSEGRRFELVVDYSKKPIGARVALTRFKSNADVACPGASWSVDRATKQVAAAVPSSCLGDPRWVRVGLAVISAPRHLRTSMGDDSRTRGRLADEHLKLGPRQPRAATE